MLPMRVCAKRLQSKQWRGVDQRRCREFAFSANEGGKVQAQPADQLIRCHCHTAAQFSLACSSSTGFHPLRYEQHAGWSE
jgi:hypothetical protein